jgi:hypothetical protein
VGLASCMTVLIGWALSLSLSQSLRSESKGSKLASPWEMTTDDAWEEAEPKNF